VFLQALIPCQLLVVGTAYLQLVLSHQGSMLTILQRGGSTNRIIPLPLLLPWPTAMLV
jgi:hypothetical protein